VAVKVSVASKYIYAATFSLKFLGRKRENPSPFKEIGGFVV